MKSRNKAELLHYFEGLVPSKDSDSTRPSVMEVLIPGSAAIVNMQ